MTRRRNDERDVVEGFEMAKEHDGVFCPEVLAMLVR
jgi:hypothetical protein